MSQPVACDAEVFLDASYTPHSDGRVKCRRQSGHREDHVATVMVRQRGRITKIGGDLYWPVRNADEASS